MKGILILLVAAFVIGYFVGKSSAPEEKVVYKDKIVYQDKQDPNAVSKSTMESEVASAKSDSYAVGYQEGRKGGIDEGYKSGYAEGIEYGKSLILSEIDLRVKEAERTDQNLPLFKVKQQ